MAWRSSGTNNDELVDNLKRFGVISSSAVETAFRKVDRKFFVPEYWKEMAHADQPLKEGNVHISAPHIYGSVLEALELKSNSSMTFLNLGSGTGYLTCLASTLMGPRSSHFCVEIHDDVIEHFKKSLTSWKSDQVAAGSDGPWDIDIIRGNALQLDLDKGECSFGFDRIYIGASIESSDLGRFQSLLKPGGILVGPVEDELVKVVRRQKSSNADTTGVDFSKQVISPVRFTPLSSLPSLETIIPARVWHPSNHRLYPDSFRKSCKTLMLCSSAKFEQPLSVKPQTRVNAASMLPRAIWMEILSYTHRDWFKAPQPEIEFLRRCLDEERLKVERAEAARLEAEQRCQRAEKERDMYRFLANAWKDRLSSSLDQQGRGSLFESDFDGEDVTTMILAARGSSSMAGIGNLLRRLGRNATTEGNGEENVQGTFFHIDEGSLGGESSEEMVVDEDHQEGSNAPFESLGGVGIGSSSGLAKASAHRQVRTVPIADTGA